MRADGTWEAGLVHRQGRGRVLTQAVYYLFCACVRARRCLGRAQAKALEEELTRASADLRSLEIANDNATGASEADGEKAKEYKDKLDEVCALPAVAMRMACATRVCVRVRVRVWWVSLCAPFCPL